MPVVLSAKAGASNGEALMFRRLAPDDLPTLHRWLNEAAVVKWWEGADVSWDAVMRDYGSPATPTTEHWIASLDGRDVGWAQCYLAAEDPEETGGWWKFGVDPCAAGIDYLIGDPADRERGLGSAMIRAFVDKVVFGLHPEWSQAAAGPFTANVASGRALARAGFRFAGEIDDEGGPCRLMVADRQGGRLRRRRGPISSWRSALRARTSSPLKS